MRPNQENYEIQLLLNVAQYSTSF